MTDINPVHLNYINKKKQTKYIIYSNLACVINYNSLY